MLQGIQSLISAFTDSTAVLDEKRLMEQFAGLGLGKRIGWLIQLRRVLDDRFEGAVPNDLADLLSFPGAGTYTANAVRCFAFGESVPLVDANVVRVLSRVFDMPASKPLRPDDEVYNLATRLVPSREAKRYNFALLDFGAVVCKKKPDCGTCVLSSMCSFNVLRQA